MEIQGQIIQVLPLQSGVGKASGKEWKKQEYIIEIPDGQFPRKVCFSLWGDLIDRTQLVVGEQVTLQVDIESREFNGRWYTDVKAWRVDRGFVSLQQPGAAPQSGFAAPQPQPAPAAAGPFGGVQPQTFDPATAPAPQVPDDLPF